jgi:hypothetical protein
MILTLIILAVMGLVLFLGYLRIQKRIRKSRERSHLVSSYLASFDSLIAGLSRGEYDENLLRKLATTADDVEEDMSRPIGSARIVPAASPLLPALRNIRRIKGMAAGVQESRDAISDHLDRLNHAADSAIRQLINPAALFVEGIKLLIGSPLEALGKAGVLDSLDIERIQNGAFFDTVAKITSVLGLIGSGVSILMHWLNYYRSVFSIIQ